MFGNPFQKGYERKRGEKAVFHLFLLMEINNPCSGSPCCFPPNARKRQVKKQKQVKIFLFYLIEDISQLYYCYHASGSGNVCIAPKNKQLNEEDRLPSSVFLC
jgi:hypothetical protein